MRASIIALVAFVPIGCATNQRGAATINFNGEFRRLSQVEELIARSDQALASNELSTALACLREACGLRPGDKRIHWKIASAALNAGEREVGYRALMMVVNLDPALENDERVVGLAKKIAALPKISRFSIDRVEPPQVKPEFSWSEFYKPQYRKNLPEQ